MTAIRDLLENDFDLVDGLEPVTFISRLNGSTVTLTKAKRFATRDHRESVDSMGFAVGDLVGWSLSEPELAVARTAPSLGDRIVDGDDSVHIVQTAFLSAVTNRWRLATVSLRHALPDSITILRRPEGAPAKGPEDPWIVHVRGIPARVWAHDQAGRDPMGDDGRPRFRCAFAADGGDVALPLPQGCHLVDGSGNVYSINSVVALDAFVGFAVAELTLHGAKKRRD